MLGQETRNKLTDYWKNHKVEEQSEYAMLTNIIHKEWSGINVSEHKQLKKLKGHNLRDHMTEAELIFTALAELSTRQIAQEDQAESFTKMPTQPKKAVPSRAARVNNWNNKRVKK